MELDGPTSVEAGNAVGDRTMRIDVAGLVVLVMVVLAVLVVGVEHPTTVAVSAPVVAGWFRVGAMAIFPNHRRGLLAAAFIGAFALVGIIAAVTWDIDSWEPTYGAAVAVVSGLLSSMAPGVKGVKRDLWLVLGFVLTPAAIASVTWAAVSGTMAALIWVGLSAGAAILAATWTVTGFPSSPSSTNRLLGWLRVTGVRARRMSKAGDAHTPGAQSQRTSAPSDDS